MIKNNIKVYNSLTNKVEDFVPLKENEISMYVDKTRSIFFLGSILKIRDVINGVSSIWKLRPKIP